MHETRRMRRLIIIIEECLPFQTKNVRKLLRNREIIKSMAAILLYPNEVGDTIHHGLRRILQSFRLLSQLGWTQDGVRFGSVAAEIQSYFGDVKMGSYFAQLQSMTASNRWYD